MKAIRAYLCYSCFSWLKPLCNSLNKKIVEENNTNKENSESIISDEITFITHQYQQLLSNYINDIMDIKTSDYFIAKKEIERINQLLTTGSSVVRLESKFSTSCFKFLKFIVINFYLI